MKLLVLLRYLQIYSILADLFCVFQPDPIDLQCKILRIQAPHKHASHKAEVPSSRGERSQIQDSIEKKNNPTGFYYQLHTSSNHVHKVLDLEALAITHSESWQLSLIQPRTPYDCPNQGSAPPLAYTFSRRKIQMGYLALQLGNY